MSENSACLYNLADFTQQNLPKSFENELEKVLTDYEIFKQKFNMFFV